MTKKILPTAKTNYNPRSKNNKFNSGLKQIVEFYKEPAQKLILHLMTSSPKKDKYSLDDISQIIGISRDAVRQNWLRPIKESE